MLPKQLIHPARLLSPLFPLLLSTFLIGHSHAMPIISEFLAANGQGLEDEDGDTSDWIEIYNPGTTIANLTGWKLTDDSSDTAKWTFPSIALAPGERLVVFASGKDRATAGSELHTNFSLNSAGEYLALISPTNTAASEFNPYPRQKTDVSYGIATTSTPLVDGDTHLRYSLSSPPADPQGDTWVEQDFDDSTWISTHNGFSATAGIGYDTSGQDNAIIDTPIAPGTTEAWIRFPFNVADPSLLSSLTLRTRHDDGFEAYLNGVLIVSNNATPPIMVYESSEFVSVDITQHLPLLSNGQNVLSFRLVNVGSTSSDFLLLPELTGTSSVLDRRYSPTPTPGIANANQSFTGYVTDTKFAIGRGFFSSGFTETITSSTPGATIVYTTNGSPPSLSNGTQVPSADANTPPSLTLAVNGTAIIRAAAFKNNFIATNSDTNTYIFPADIPSQSSWVTRNTYGFPASWASSPATVPDYGMDTNVVGPGDLFGGAYAASIQNDLQAVPTLSIVTDLDHLFGSSGIYSHPQSSGPNWERPVSLELINPDGSPGFQENCGLRIQGGWFRRLSETKKKSLRVLFKKQYGKGKLAYDFFGDGATKKFNTLTFRMEANDGWQWKSAGTQPQYARDQFGRDSQLALGQPSSHGRHMHLYINGVYWGLYNPVERPDSEFASSYFNIPEQEWDGINSGSTTNASDDPDRNSRAQASWNTFLGRAQAVANADTRSARHAAYMDTQGRNANGTNNPSRECYVDMANYIDYLLVNYYAGNSDWPNKNYYCGRHNHPSSEGFKFFMWDCEWSLLLRSNVNTDQMEDSRGVAAPFQELRASEAFRILFADRAHRALFNGGAFYVDPSNPSWNPLHPERNVPAARYHSITEEIKSPLVAESARWGDQHWSPVHTVNNEWADERAKILTDWMPVRSANFLQQLKNKGLYPNTQAPVFSQHGGGIPAGFMLGISNSNPGGTIYYTTNGTDPLQIEANGTFSVASGASVYSSPVPLTSAVTVKARVLHASEWSALNEADFSLGATPTASNLVISEFCYNPADSAPAADDGDDFEFIEIMNTGADALDLTHAEFDTGITFDLGTVPLALRTLAPGARAIICEDSTAFQNRYGSSHTILGEWSGKLSNSGETLRLRIKGGSTIQSFTYNDKIPWPSCADGDGYSLVLINPTSNPDHNIAANWRCSTHLHGTPGGSDSLPAFAGNPTSDLDKDGLAAQLEHFLDSLDSNVLDGLDRFRHSIVEISEGGNVTRHPSITFRRKLGADDLEHRVEVSTTLASNSWQSGASHVIQIDAIHHGDGTSTETWRTVAPISDHDKLFIRLRVTPR